MSRWARWTGKAAAYRLLDIGLPTLNGVEAARLIDADSGKTIADIPGQKHNHGVALAPEAGRGFITDGEGSVVIFDLKTNAVLGTLKAPPDADGIIYDKATGLVLVSCGGQARKLYDRGSWAALRAVTGFPFHHANLETFWFRVDKRYGDTSTADTFPKCPPYFDDSGQPFGCHDPRIPAVCDIEQTLVRRSRRVSKKLDVRGSMPPMGLELLCFADHQVLRLRQGERFQDLDRLYICRLLRA